MNIDRLTPTQHRVRGHRTRGRGIRDTPQGHPSSCHNGSSQQSDAVWSAWVKGRTQKSHAPRSSGMKMRPPGNTLNAVLNVGERVLPPCQTVYPRIRSTLVIPDNNSTSLPRCRQNCGRWRSW
ncbi:hypothetical protein KCP73_21735 [Salmonella enterica subsp. enterica]|nr:hypothetical protein KCP73_21735 [Salmonella enterica subsp. enterica]